MRHHFFLLATFFSVSLGLMTADAATITAVTSGSWVNPATWSCHCLPGKSDDILIPKGITVTVSRPIMLAPGNNIVITIAGAIDLTNGTLQLDELDWITILPGGRIFANGLGGTIYSGITPIVLERRSYILGPAAINKTNPVQVEKSLVSHSGQ